MTDPANGRVVLYTFNGAGVTMWDGPPAEVGRAVDARTIYWQPVAYYAAPTQMKTNTEQAEAEFLRLATQVHPGRKFILCAYSEGAIAASNLLDRMRTGDLQNLYPLFLGAATFGNPRRETHHTIGKNPFNAIASDPGGSGVAPNCLVNTPDTWWDLANPGDLYAACTATGAELDDIHAIYDIVQSWFSGVLELIGRILELVANPTTVIGAAEAIYYAITFFGVHKLLPHTTYERTTPVPGNPATCLNWAVYHVNRLAAGLP